MNTFRNSLLESKKEGAKKRGRVRRSLTAVPAKFKELSSRKKAGVGLAAVIIILSGAFLFNVFGIKAASYNWFQTDWSGGADTVNFPNHTNNQSGWTKFYSKDANVDVTTSPGDAKLTQATGTSLQTSDTGTGDTPNAGGFNAWTKTNAYVSGTGTGASINLVKPLGATCTADAECVGSPGCCDSGTCSSCSSWISGPCSGIRVYNADLSGTYQWKTAQTSCVGPQCAIGLDTSYPSNYSLVADNSVDFSTLGYTARQACKAIFGRLPTMAQLSCIYTNRTSYGSFQSDNYWSATEYNTSNAWNVNFLNGNAYIFNKTDSLYARCVR